MSHYPPPQRYVEKRGANHGLHLFLTLITCGLWAITGWPIAAAMGRKKVVTGYPQGQMMPTPPPQQGYGPPPHGWQPPPGQYPPQQ
ncbi:hypothetical protein [Streptomyces sp. NPDC001635]